ncbi:hypothetical protein FSP39_020054, partial [Pinctada imbricata]
ILDELERNSFVVIPDVISNTECNKFIKEYREWYGNFKGKRREFLRQRQSVVQNFWVGHLEASWKIRLKVKPIFEKIWETTQLLTSVDGVAISAPPEEETEGFNMKNPEFRSETDSWLHLDQGKSRVGRHAIQGAVYLETSSSDDYCFRVMKGSENYHREFLNKMRPNIEPNTTFIKLKPHEISWFEERGCETTFVEVPKGGMILWDSRTVHDNLPPRRGRSSGNRWRHVCFVTMTPAKWAGPEDLEVKKRMYNERLMSSHWASQGIKILASACWVPGHLTVDQKHTRRTALRANLNLEFVSEILSLFFKETKHHHFTPEAKLQSKQWKHPGSPRPKKAKTVLQWEGYGPGFLGCRRYSADILSPKGQTLNGT